MTQLKGTLKNSLQRSWNIPEEDDLALGLVRSKSGLTQLTLKLGLTEESGLTRPNVAIRIRFYRVVISTHRCLFPQIADQPSHSYIASNH